MEGMSLRGRSLEDMLSMNERYLVDVVVEGRM